MELLIPLVCGYLLDLLIGDPEWLSHPVRWMGHMITWLETRLRACFPKTPKAEQTAGVLLVVVMGSVWLLFPMLLLWLAGRIHPILAIVLESWMCFRILAIKSLKTESMRVYYALRDTSLAAARNLVGRIVGRDTDCLDEADVVRATVETIAENTGDGIVSPLLFLAFGGAPLGFFFKAVSTLDSMVGYRNARYLYFGSASARFDDVLNFIPARICGALMVIAALPAGLNRKEAWRIFQRDRKKHSSPNAAHPEAACAGALELTLGGDAVYGGVMHHKPTLGDGSRDAKPEDILRANRLMLWTTFLAFLLAVGIRGMFYLFL